MKTEKEPSKELLDYMLGYLFPTLCNEEIVSLVLSNEREITNIYVGFVTVVVGINLIPTRLKNRKGKVS